MMITIRTCQLDSSNYRPRVAYLCVARHRLQPVSLIKFQCGKYFKHACMTYKRNPHTPSLVAFGVLLAMTLTGGITRAAALNGNFSVTKLGLIPLPRQVAAYKAKWQVPVSVRIVAVNPAQRNVARFMQRFLKRRGITAKVASTGPAQITLSTSAADPQLGREGYRLEVTRHGAALSANTGHGLFYALQTFEQLFNPAHLTDNAIHNVAITDWPRYRWRGVMLDCVRHFLPVPVVEKFIRVAAHYKLNMFHWHLTDDQVYKREKCWGALPLG